MDGILPPCNVARGSGIMTSWSPQSICHSAPVCEILSNFAHGRKMTSCRFSRWQISAIMHFRSRINGIMGSLKSPCTTSYRSSIETIALFSFWENRFFFILAPGRLTEKQIGRPIALSRSRCRKRRLSKLRVTFTQDDRRASKILWYDGIEISI